MKPGHSSASRTALKRSLQILVNWFKPGNGPISGHATVNTERYVVEKQLRSIASAAATTARDKNLSRAERRDAFAELRASTSLLRAVRRGDAPHWGRRLSKRFYK